MNSRTEMLDRMRDLDRVVEELRSEIAALPAREPHIESPTGRIIRARVNQVGGASPANSTVPWDTPTNLVPWATGFTPPATGTFDNTVHPESFADNAVVYLFWNPSTGAWEPDRGGGGSNSLIVLFELTQDKAYGDVAKKAKALDASGVVGSGSEFYVLDANGRFYGKAAAGLFPGFKGSGILVSDAYVGADGTKPAYRIITMEGPAQIVLVELAESWSMSGTHCTPLGIHPFGRDDQGRLIFSEEEGATAGDIFVQDTLNVAGGAVIGDRWSVLWDEAGEKYEFFLPLVPSTATATLVAAMITGNVPAVDHADLDGSAITAEAGISASAVAYILQWLPSLPPRREQHASFGAPLFVVNETETAIIGSTAEPSIYHGYLQTFLDAEDVEVLCFVPVREDRRSVTGFDRTKKQHIKSDASTGAYDHQEIGPCTA
jgi:hypothetical protein